MEGVCVVVVKWQVRRATIAKLLILSCLESQSLNDAVSRSLRWRSHASDGKLGGSIGASKPTTASLRCYMRPREDRDGQSPESLTQHTVSAYAQSSSRSSCSYSTSKITHNGRHQPFLLRRTGRTPHPRPSRQASLRRRSPRSRRIHVVLRMLSFMIVPWSRVGC